MEKHFNQYGPKLCIKHMVCPRCIYVVKSELERLKIPFREVRLGDAELIHSLDEAQYQLVKTALEKFGFELIEDQKAKVVEQVKTLVLEMVRYKKEPVHLKHSEYLARETGRDYSMLTSLFSASEGITIEKYFILQRIEFVKELLSYNELSLSQIAGELSYSDVGYLSRQFKSVTGITPTAYKKQNCQNRKCLNEIISAEILQNSSIILQNGQS